MPNITALLSTFWRTDVYGAKAIVQEVTGNQDLSQPLWRRHTSSIGINRCKYIELGLLSRQGKKTQKSALLPSSRVDKRLMMKCRAMAEETCYNSRLPLTKEVRLCSYPAWFSCLLQVFGWKAAHAYAGPTCLGLRPMSDLL